jgi:hypothetical protein
LRLVRFASPTLAAGMVATSPTSSVPIGYIIGLISAAPVQCRLGADAPA